MVHYNRKKLPPFFKLTIDDEYYGSMKDYELIDHQDYFSLSKEYGNEIRLVKELKLNENFYLLQKL